MFAWLYDWLVTVVTWVLSLLGIQWSSAALSSAALSSGALSSAESAMDSTSATPSLDPLPLDTLSTQSAPQDL